MEREVARVAAACDLRAFRYLPFPGIEFDPLPLQAELAPELVQVPEPDPSAAILSIPSPPEPAAAPPPELEPEPFTPPIPEPGPVAPPPATPPPPPRPDVPHPDVPRLDIPRLDIPRLDIPRQAPPDWDVPEPPPRQVAPAHRYRMLEDLAIDGRDFTFGSFIDSQAAGDAAVLRDNGRPVLRLHLTDVEAGLARVRELIAHDS